MSIREELKKLQEEGIQKAFRRALKEVKKLTGLLSKKDRELERKQKKIEKLEAEIKRLKDELSCKRKAPKWAKPNRKGTSKKKIGPKQGHAPSKRKPIAANEVTHEIILDPKSCPACNKELPDPSRWHGHIQIDLPEFFKPLVTQFQVGWSYCSHCKKEVSATTDKLERTKYGPRLHAMVTYWKLGLGLTLGKIQTNLKDSYDLNLSTGVISAMVSRVSSHYEEPYKDLLEGLRDEPNLNGDESGWRVNGINHWLWSFSNENVSCYMIDRSRSQQVVEKVLGKEYSGVLTTDFYGAYNKIKSKKQKCWAHLLRELSELKKLNPRNKEIQQYLEKLKNLFYRAKRLRARHAKGEEIQKALNRLDNETRKFARQKRRHQDLKRISKRITKYRDELYTFIEAGTDPTNNAAEREIRPAVLMRKVSYGNRSDQGAHAQAVLMSMIRTCQKQGLSFTAQATEQLLRR